MSNPNPNFRNQDLSLPPIPTSQLGKRSRSDIDKSVIVFRGYNLLEREPTLMEDGAKFEWYSIPVPYAPSLSLSLKKKKKKKATIELH